MAITTDDLKDIPHVVIVEDHNKQHLQKTNFEGPGCMEAAHVFAQEQSMKRRGVVVTVACRVRTITAPPEPEPELEDEAFYIGKLRRIWREQYLDDDHTMSFGEWLREASWEYD